MADKNVEQITARDVDFAKWYTDIVKKADLIDYSSVRGCVILKPAGYALWENLQKYLDAEIKRTGHENVQMPLFIPESLLNKEKDHVEGFAPEVAWVTHGGEQELAEHLCVRPTSEVLFCELYAKEVQSYRDLPKLYNQWCNVVRWEKTTRPFLRSMEFLWQEGHTVHIDEEDARAETLRMLEVYVKTVNELLAIPVICGRKTPSERFAGAVDTYTIEAMMHDGKALQSGTSHYIGTGFAEAFGMTYLDKDNERKLVHQTSWGMSTRILGAVIMVHSDDNGLVLPPHFAPVQVVIVPIAQHKEGVLSAASSLLGVLGDVRAKIDDSDHAPGWKFAEHEMRGVPIRIEIGPKDIEAGQVVVVRRDTREKCVIPIGEVGAHVPEMLEQIHGDMFARAKEHLEANIRVALNMGELRLVCENGFAKAMWCEDDECEAKIKEEMAVTSRCIPFEQESAGEACVCCGKPAETMVIWGKAY